MDKMTDSQLISIGTLLRAQVQILRPVTKNDRILLDSLVNALPRKNVWQILKKISSDPETQ